MKPNYFHYQVRSQQKHDIIAKNYKKICSKNKVFLRNKSFTI